MSLIEVLIALSLVAALALEVTKLHVSQMQSRREIAVRTAAATLLDVLAETHRMGLVGGVRVPAMWQVRARAALPDGRIDLQPLTADMTRLIVSWRHGSRAGKNDNGKVAEGNGISAFPTAAQSVRSVCERVGAGRVCLSTVVSTEVSTASSANPTLRARGADGYALLELLVATAVAAVAIGTSLAVFDTARVASARAIDDSRMRMVGRSALDTLTTYLRLAGYGRHLQSAREEAVFLPVQACGNPATNPATKRHRAVCADVAPRTDGLAIGYRADRASAWRARGGGAPLDCEGHSLPFQGAQTTARFIVRAIRGRAQGHNLHCSRHAGAAGEPVVENVEQLRLRYWLPDAHEARRADAIADADWQRVRGLDVCVVVRGERRGDAAPYRDCDGRLQVAASDGYRRQAYGATVAFRNVDGQGNDH